MIQTKNITEKIYHCTNFQYPYIKIKKQENKYTLKFQDQNHNTTKITKYHDTIPKEIEKIFKLENNQTIHGLITEIKCIQTAN